MDDTDDFETVFESHHEVVWRYLARLGGPQVADDLAGEVFVRAFERRTSFDPSRGEMRSWLYGIATNVWRSDARSSSRRSVALARLRRSVPASAIGQESTVDSSTDAARAYPEVLRALHTLRADDQAVLVLFAWEELSYDQIAASLGVPIGTVRSRLSRARRRLRELLASTGELVSE